MLTARLDSKLDELLGLLSSLRPVLVAFSAGVDSTVLAAAAFRACGSDASALLSVSPSVPAGTEQEARRLATLIGIDLRIVHTREFDRADYVANQHDRCFYCKDTLYSAMNSLLAELNGGDMTLVNGANLDDQSDHRPGMRAAVDHGVRSPFIETGFTKQDIRDVARTWQLPVWDKPASPCLSSRIAYGIEVTAERVKRVDDAENFLRSLLEIRELRVRLTAENTARIELPNDAIARSMSDQYRETISRTLKELGFQFVTIDLAGFRSGSLNAVIPLSDLENAAFRSQG